MEAIGTSGRNRPALSAYFSSHGFRYIKAIGLLCQMIFKKRLNKVKRFLFGIKIVCIFAIMEKLKEELTEAMHSEFTVDEETEIKHRCFSALECISEFNYPIEKAVKIYNVSFSDIEKHKAEFESFSAE